MIAPDRLCAPHVLPFSTTATGTSPSFSATSGSSAMSWSSRFAQARPAGPPPTMTTPTSIRSPGGSVGAAMNSSMGLTGGGYALGATLSMNRDGTSQYLLVLERGGVGRLGG